MGTDRTNRLRERAHALIPAGAHTYAKGDDQFPEEAPGFIVRGAGAHVWDVEGREYIEYGSGLRAVTLGHAFAPVVDAARRTLELGVNFSRPSPIEVDCAEQFLAAVPTAEMVKFCKDGSHALDGAIRLSRAYTGRDIVAICADHPFYSTSDWFIGTTQMNAGIPQAVRDLVVTFRYNDLSSLQTLFDRHDGQIACVIMEAARTEEPAPGFLEEVRELTRRRGAVLVFDEMITGFRWHRHGAQHLYGVVPDLSAFGKGLANGFSVSALAGRRELMRLGGNDHDRERVFLLSTTHGAQTHELAAAIATMRVYETEPVVETLYARGKRLREGIRAAAEAAGVQAQLSVSSRDCNLLFHTLDAQGKPSQAYRTLFMQELVARGVIAPSFVVGYSHTEADIDATVEAIHAAARVYHQALDSGPERFLRGRAVQPVFRKYANR